ncbi:MAG TPA: hypothetical protein HA254_03520 [Candidatus Diapherotrites archaeon]|uniref:Signal-peptide peptidase, presenilin aspartyl protease n=1 Tax=Candidatus Iainarchaeum sp. TaxID=3101447 RepID=A0A7J4IW20_9ARCH|nr:hypothetical protein [Candidatus Diapherotrites archaeon]
MNTRLMAQFALVFLVTQLLGLYAGNYLIEEQIHATVINDNPESVDNSLGLIAMMLASTGALLLVLRYAPEWFMALLFRAMESLAVFATTLIVLLPSGIADNYIFAIAILIVALRIIFSRQLLLRNIASIVSAAGAGALIGASLGVLPIIVFLALLAIYDFIAVFKTKHMVELAKGLTKRNLAFTLALPTKEHQFELGTGDLVVPLAFAVSTLAASKQQLLPPASLVTPSLVLLASFLGLIATLHYASGRRGKALPALPLQCALMVFAFAAAKIAGF